MSKFNNGSCLSFQEIKKNRSVAVKEMAEGNEGLELLLNTCIDVDLETRSCCGEEQFLMFELNEGTIGKLASIFNCLEENGMDNFLSVGCSDMGNFVTFHFDSFELCKLVSDVIKGNNTDFNLTLGCMDAIISKLKEYDMELFFSYDGLLYYADVVNFNVCLTEDYPEIGNYICRIDEVFSGDGRVHELYSFGNKDNLAKLTYALYSDVKQENAKKGFLGKLKNFISETRVK